MQKDNVFSFTKSMGKYLTNKYSQKLLRSAKKSTTDAIKTSSKRVVQKTIEATGDLIDSEIADKRTSVSKSPTPSKNDDANSEITDTYLWKKGNKLLMN